jgi:hypothetical protein
MKYRTIALVSVAIVVVLLCSFPAITAAQSETARAFAARGLKEPTNIPGVRIYADRPKGFDPIMASNEELAAYGLPPRPPIEAGPKAFARWHKAMTAIAIRPAAHLVAMPYSSTQMKPGKAAPIAASGAPTQYGSYNWSGVVLTNTQTVWNNNISFDQVSSVFNVPSAQPPAGACSNGITGPFYEVSWNGIDGFSSGGLVQGGSLSFATCTASGQNGFYLGWVEWYPSYPILEIVCGTSPTVTACPVFPGDDFYVVTYGVAGCADQTVFVEDITTGWAGAFELGWITGPCLVGSSAEWIVERPGLGSGGLGALANTVFDFFDYSYAFEGQGREFYAGSSSPTTAVVTMVADDGETPIEFVESGSGGYQGLYSLWFQSENCSVSGGCAP